MIYKPKMEKSKLKESSKNSGLQRLKKNSDHHTHICRIFRAMYEIKQVFDKS